MWKAHMCMGYILGIEAMHCSFFPLPTTTNYPAPTHTQPPPPPPANTPYIAQAGLDSPLLSSLYFPLCPTITVDGIYQFTNRSFHQMLGSVSKETVFFLLYSQLLAHVWYGVLIYQHFWNEYIWSVNSFIMTWVLTASWWICYTMCSGLQLSPYR